MGNKALPEVLAEGAARGAKGLRCPSCGCPDLAVYYSRKGNGRIKRIRRCDHCGRQVLTFETPAS